jgi:hypothetical protein
VGIAWIQLAQDREQWWALVNKVILYGSIKDKEFQFPTTYITRYITYISFTERISLTNESIIEWKIHLTDKSTFRVHLILLVV